MSSCSELKMIALVCLFFNILNWILCLLSSFQAFLSSVLYNLFHFLKCVYCDSVFVLCSPFMALSTIAVLYKSVLSLISVHQPTQGTIDLCGHEHFFTNLTIFRSLQFNCLLFCITWNYMSILALLCKLSKWSKVSKDCFLHNRNEEFIKILSNGIVSSWIYPDMLCFL